MHAQWTYTSRLTPHELYQRLEDHYDEQPTFRLISRLSEAGVVVRSIHPPEGAEKSFFGHKTEKGFSLVQNRGKINLTPYQPILRISAGAWNQGSKVNVVLKPHKNAKPLVGLFVVFGIILLGLGVLNIAVNTFLAICSCSFGLCFVLFPCPHNQIRQRNNTPNPCGCVDNRYFAIGMFDSGNLTAVTGNPLWFPRLKSSKVA